MPAGDIVAKCKICGIRRVFMLLLNRYGMRISPEKNVSKRNPFRPQNIKVGWPRSHRRQERAISNAPTVSTNDIMAV